MHNALRLDPNVIWELCRSAYAANGLKLAIPANTPLHKTYQWRLIVSLTAKLESYGFDLASAAIFLKCCAEHIRERSLQYRGLSVLLQQSMLTSCYERITRMQAELKEQITWLSSTKKFITEHATRSTAFEIMVLKQSLAQPCNLVRWYQAGHVSPLYLVLSRTGAMAVTRISKKWPREREHLPKDSELYQIARRVGNDNILREECKNVLAEDWREQCLLSPKSIHPSLAGARKNETQAHSVLIPTS